MRYPIRIGYYSDHLPYTNIGNTGNEPIYINGFTFGIGDLKALFIRTDLYINYNWWIIEDEVGNAYTDRAIVFGASLTGSF